MKTDSHHWPHDDGNNYEDALGQLARHHQPVFSLQTEMEGKVPQHVLSIAVHNERRAVTEYRGKYNHRPFDKKRSAQKYWQERPYLYFLQQSPRILRQWMQREGLVHG